MKSRITYGEVRIVDEGRSILEFLASDETQDSYNEVIKADGWRFNIFQKNRPFVDSHNYGSVFGTLGQVVDWRIHKKGLYESVQFATAIEDNKGPRIAYEMYKGGFLRGVSVGFKPVRFVSRYSSGDSQAQWDKELAKLKLEDGAPSPNRIYLEQEQIELSAVVIGANPNAIIQNSAKAYKAEVLNDSDIAWLSELNFARSNETDRRAQQAADALRSRRRAFLNAFDREIQQLKKAK